MLFSPLVGLCQSANLYDVVSCCSVSSDSISLAHLGKSFNGLSELGLHYNYGKTHSVDEFEGLNNRTKNQNTRDTSILINSINPELESNQDDSIVQQSQAVNKSKKENWRPVLSVSLGGISPWIYGPVEWNSPDEGLGFLFGYGGEFSIGFNPINLIGIEISQGYSNHVSYLPAVELSNSTTTEREELILTSAPTSAKINLFVSKKFGFNFGLTTSMMSINNSDPEISNERMDGFFIGLQRLYPVGKKKNYIEFTGSYYSLSSKEGFQFELDTEKLPQYEDLMLTLEDINYIEFKLKFYFGLVH